MKTLYQFSILVVLLLVSGCGETSGEKTSGVPHVALVLRHGETLLAAASNPKYPREERRRAVKIFFDHLSTSKMRFGDLLKQIGTNPEWISYDGIEKVDKGNLVGWIPDPLRTGTGAFTIPVLSGEPNDYNVVVFLTFEEDLPLQEVIDALRGKGNAETLNAKIVMAVSWDTADLDNIYPGASKAEWPW